MSAPSALRFPKTTGAPTQRQRAARAYRRTLLAKAESKIRDFHHCQFPGCHAAGIGYVESMHLENAGMGGRPSVGSTAADFVTGCRDHHQGPRSIHSGHLVMRPRTAAGGDGPIDWFRRPSLDAQLRYVGTSRPLGGPHAIR